MVKNNYEWDESKERKDKKIRHTSNAKKIRDIDDKGRETEGAHCSGFIVTALRQCA